MNIQKRMLEAIEEELQRQVARLDQPRTKRFHEMLTYHMGWTGEGAGAEATGKRIRPLLVLLSAASFGLVDEGEVGKEIGYYWLHAKSAAAAIELIHNFSLVHDDIQDNSDKRRGRNTVWVNWGAPMAINVGDALFVIANQAILDLAEYYPSEVVVKVAGILNNSCLDLTRGQFLDMSYEERNNLGIDDYWPMVGGKTSALLAACTQIGALLGNAGEAEREACRLFGWHLGLAFQVQDDILGIWGDEAITGKSAASDLVEGKNSLPVLYGLGKQGKFAERWAQGPIKSDEVKTVAKLLEDEGGKKYAEEISIKETQKALEYLDRANLRGEAGESIRQLANMLLKRKQ
ncbi:MAG: polyprenyl synthetase family protein [Anaerolineales bacterium]|nr:polyprenyl synthetase family protein [Anaerolineales bacterium]